VSRGPYRKPYRIFYFMVSKLFFSEDYNNRLRVFINDMNLITITNESDNEFNDSVFCFENPEEAIEFADEIKRISLELIEFYKTNPEN